MDSNALPKGHIIGWTPAPAASKGAGSTPLSKNAKKRQKQKEKKAEAVKENWEDEDAQDGEEADIGKRTASTSETGKGSSGTHTPDRSNWVAVPPSEKKDNSADVLAGKLEKLGVQ